MKIIKSALLFSIFYFLISNNAFATITDLNKAIEEKVKVLQVINEQIEKTEKRIETIQDEERTLKKDLQKIDYGLSQLNLSIKASEINIDKLNLELKALQSDIQDTENSLLVKKAAIIRLLRVLHQRDRESLLLALLKHQSLANSLTEFHNFNRLNNQLSFEVKDLKAIQENLLIKFSGRSDKKTRLVNENGALKNRRGLLGDQKNQRATLLAQTKNKEKIYQEQLEELEKRQLVIGEEIGKIEAELRRTFDPSILPIKRPGVLAKPVPGRLTQEYGHTAFAHRAYKSQFHNGADFHAPLGTPILAADNGEVIAVGNTGRLQYGKYIVIKHENNLSTLYAHLSSQTVIKGQWVKGGELIGYTGNTGYSFGPHLHFSVYWAPSVRLENIPSCNCGLVPIGITIDPLDYL